MHFIAQRIIDRSLTRYGGSASGFSTTTRFEQPTSMTRSNATQLSSALSFRGRTTEATLQCF
ncbi:MAG TPA: hypothetical protein VHQ94_10360 [Pyrinomonadaceae bacterium]|nr:hypothetical protein [Pyrinomonadaceae bacterium]